MTCVVSKICSHADGCDMRYRYTVERCSAFEERQTNFSRITVSPEALAEFIENHCSCINCPTECPAKELCDDYRSCRRAMVMWLKQESEQ